MYDGVSMDRAYSGSTLIWCKNCPAYTTFVKVYQGEPIIKGTDYVIGDSHPYNFLHPDFTMGSATGCLVFHADDNYPAVYESLCEGYVTDLGAAFGISIGNTGNRHHDRTLIINPNNKQSLSAYIGYDWKNPHNPDRNVIMKGEYGLQSYYLYTPNVTYNDVGYNLFPLNTGTAYDKLYLYRVDYIYA